MLIILLLIGFCWNIFCLIFGINKVYLYIFLVNFGIEGIYTIIFCEMLGEGMEIARTFYPTNTYVNEEEEVAGVNKNRIYIKSEEEPINLYLLTCLILSAGLLIYGLTGLKIPSIVWESQPFSIAVFITLWFLFLKDKNNKVVYLIGMGMSIMNTLLCINLYEFNPDVILIYSFIFYELILSSSFNLKNKNKNKSKNKYNPNITIEYRDYKNKSDFDFGGNLVTFTLLSYLIGLSKSLILKGIYSEDDNESVYYNYQRYIVLKASSICVSLFLAIYSLGSRDASANYISLITNSISINNNIIFYSLFGIFCLLVCCLIKPAFNFSLTLLQYINIPSSVISFFRYSSLSLIFVFLQFDFDFRLILILFSGFITFRFIRINSLDPLVASTGISILPFLALFNFI